jgi:N-acetylglucosaminyl-diphospho-decaprenol L-rhamnosyltransferase
MRRSMGDGGAPDVVSIVIVNWNTRDLLADLLSSVQEHAPAVDSEILVVDNASSDGSQEMVAERFPTVRLLTNRANAGFARGVNQAIRESSGGYILLLNTDMLVLEGTIDAQVAFMESNPQCGVCGGQLLDQEQRLALSYGHFPGIRSLLTDTVLHHLGWDTSLGCVPAPEQEQPLDVDYVSGADLMIRRQAVEQIGLLDEQFFLYFEETDWCYRAAQAGWKVTYVPAVRYVHLGSASSRDEVHRQEQFHTSLDLFLRKHYRGMYYAACWLLGRLRRILVKRRAKKSSAILQHRGGRV